MFLQKKGDSRAAGLARAIAVEDEFTFTCETRIALLNFLGGHDPRARERIRECLPFKRRTQVQDDDRMTRIHPAFKIVRRQARGVQVFEKLPAANIPVRDIARQEDNESGRQTMMSGGHPPIEQGGLITEKVADSRKSAHVSDPPDSIVKDKLRQADPRDSGQRPYDRVDTGNEFREYQRTCAVTQETLLGM